MNPQLEAQIQALRSRLNQAITTLESSNLPNSGERVELLNYTQNILGNIDNSLGLFYAEKILRLNENWPSEDFELDGDNLTPDQITFKNNLERTVQQIGNISRPENREDLYAQLIAPLATKAFQTFPKIARKFNEMWLESQIDPEPTGSTGFMENMGRSMKSTHIAELDNKFTETGTGEIPKAYKIIKSNEGGIHKFAPPLNSDENSKLNELKDSLKKFLGEGHDDYEKFINMINDENSFVIDSSDNKYKCTPELNRLWNDILKKVKIKMREVEDYYLTIKNQILSDPNYDFNSDTNSLFKKIPDGISYKINEVLKTFSSLKKATVEDVNSYYGDMEYTTTAKTKIKTALDAAFTYELVWDKEKRKPKENVQQNIQDAIDDLLFEAYSSGYIRGQLDDKRGSEDRIAEAIKQNLSTDFNQRVKQVLDVITSKLAIEAIDNPIESPNPDLVAFRNFCELMKDHIHDTRELHDVNRQALSEANKVVAGTKDLVKGFFTWKTGISQSTKKNMAKMIDKFKLSSDTEKENDENEKSKYENNHQKVSGIFYSLLVEEINANDGVIPKDLFLAISTSDNSLYKMEVGIIKEFRMRLEEFYKPKTLTDQNKITTLAWTFISVEILTDRLVEFLSQSHTPLGNQGPFDKRPMQGLLTVRNPTHHWGAQGLFGVKSFGNTTGTLHSTEWAKIPMERVSDLMKFGSMKEAHLLDPGTGMGKKLAALLEYAAKNPKATLEMAMRSLTGEGTQVPGVGGVGIQTPDQNKTFSDHLINYTSFDIEGTGASVSGKKEIETFQNFFGGLFFEDALRNGRTDGVLTWMEMQKQHGMELLTHSKKTEALNKMIEKEIKEIKSDERMSEERISTLSEYPITYTEKQLFLLTTGRTADLFELTKAESKTRTENSMLLSFANIATGAKGKTKEKLEKLQKHYKNAKERANLRVISVRSNHPETYKILENDAKSCGISIEEFFIAKFMRESIGVVELSKLVLAYEADGKNVGQSFQTKIQGDHTFTELLDLNLDKLQAEALTNLDPSELINSLLMRIPALGKGMISFRDEDGNTQNKSAFEFFFNTDPKNIGNNDAKSLQQTGRHDILVAFRAFWKNGKPHSNELENRENMIHVKKFMDLFTGSHEFIDNFPKNDDKVKNLNPQEKAKLTFKVINKIIQFARFGAKDPILISSKGKWILNPQIDKVEYFSKLPKSIPKGENDKDKAKNEYLDALENQLQEKLVKSLLTDSDSFFSYFYSIDGSGSFKQNGLIGDESTADNVWFRFGKIWNRGWGVNTPIPHGYIDSVARITQVATEGDEKEKGQVEVLYEVQTLFNESKKELSAMAKTKDDKKFFEKIVEIHDKMGTELTKYKSFADKDFYQVDLFRLVIRLIGENPELRGVSGFFKNFTTQGNISVATAKKRVFSPSAWAPNTQGFENYANMLYNDKLVTFRGYNSCLEAVNAHYFERAFHHFIPLYGLGGVAYFMTWAITDAIKEGMDDAGFDADTKKK